MNRNVLRFVSLAAAASAAFSASAAVFDFESAVDGSYSSLAQTSGGLTLTLARQGGALFNVSNPFDSAFGTHSISPFQSNDFTASFIGNFSSAVGGVELDLGDFGQDADSFTLSIYSGLDGTGTLLGTVDGGLPGGGNSFSATTLGVTGTGARSFVFSGDPSAAFPVSVFLDNVNATPLASNVPGPLAALPFALGLLRRRRKA